MTVCLHDKWEKNRLLSNPITIVISVRKTTVSFIKFRQGCSYLFPLLSRIFMCLPFLFRDRGTVKDCLEHPWFMVSCVCPMSTYKFVEF